MMAKRLAKELNGRQGAKRGDSRRKRGDTQVKTLRAQYGEQFLPGFRATTRLDAVLKKTGAESLLQLLKKKN
jgi:hypothetical protein